MNISVFSWRHNLQLNFSQDYNDLFTLFRKNRANFYTKTKLIVRSEICRSVNFNVINILQKTTISDDNPLVVEGNIDLTNEFKYILTAEIKDFGVFYENVPELTPINMEWDGINPWLDCEIHKINFFPPRIELQGISKGNYFDLDYLDLRFNLNVYGKRSDEEAPIFFHILAEGLYLRETNQNMAFFYIFSGFEAYINNPLQTISLNLSLKDKIKLHFGFKFNGINLKTHRAWSPIISIFEHCKIIRDSIAHGKQVTVTPIDIDYILFLFFLVYAGIEYNCKEQCEYKSFLMT